MHMPGAQGLKSMHPAAKMCMNLILNTGIYEAGRIGIYHRDMTQVIGIYHRDMKQVI